MAYCTNDALWNDTKVDDIVTLNVIFALKKPFRLYQFANFM